jgi:hypothetical protein
MDKLDTLDREQLIQVIKWTLNDLNNAANSTNYAKLDEKVKGWCAMLEEAVLHQINKAHNNNSKWYEEE